jgi:hypothetical protein
VDKKCITFGITGSDSSLPLFSGPVPSTPILSPGAPKGQVWHRPAVVFVAADVLVGVGHVDSDAPEDIDRVDLGQTDDSEVDSPAVAVCLHPIGSAEEVADLVAAVLDTDVQHPSAAEVERNQVGSSWAEFAPDPAAVEEDNPDEDNRAVVANSPAAVIVVGDTKDRD